MQEIHKARTESCNPYTEILQLGLGLPEPIKQKEMTRLVTQDP